MSLREVRKLKRGLKDISPLFDQSAIAGIDPEQVHLRFFEPSPKTSPEVISVFSPDSPGDSLFLNTFLSSQIACEEKPCSILSLKTVSSEVAPSFQPVEKIPQIQTELYGPSTKRLSLSWDQFEKICQSRNGYSLSNSSIGQILFLDFDSFYHPQMERAVSLLDKWIFFVKPTLESLSETYKILKTLAYFNRHLDYFILFEGYPDDPRGSALFEKLSVLALKQLDLQLFWLGYLNFSHSNQYIVSEITLEYLFSSSDKKVNSPEKWALSERIHSIFSSSPEEIF